ncbi:hypothetical protein Trydic_g2487 [Trypoxylus dichotomus]
MLLNRYKEVRKPSINLLKRFYTSELLDHENVTPVQLSYASYETQKTDRNHPPLVIVHGYLASKRNWVHPSKELLEKTNPQRKIIAIDLRNHGDSPHSPEHSNNHIVRDIKEFINSFPFKTVALMGHSYGGLTSMLFALLYPDKVEKLIVVDIAPRDQRKNLQHVKDILDAVMQVSIPPKIPMTVARSLIDEQLKKRVPEKGYRAFLLTQLVRREDGQDHVVETGFFPEIIGKIYEKPTIFIGGEKSAFLRKEDEVDTKRYFPEAKFHYIPGAGHVVHADKPKEFIKICVDFLNKPEDSIVPVG